MFALVFPPIIMLLFSMVGALAGLASMQHPQIFVGFIAFGVVALLSLVVNELLVEARVTQEGHEVM